MTPVAPPGGGWQQAVKIDQHVEGGISNPI